MASVLCRLCLSESENAFDVSEVREGLPISVIAMIILPVKITNDSLPQKICDECLEIVMNAYKLRDVSNNTDRYLRSVDGEIHEIEIENDEDQEIEKVVNNEELFCAVQEDEEPTIIEEELMKEESGAEEFVDYDPNFKLKVDTHYVQTKKSAVWSYFGILTDEMGQVVESEKSFFFCKICVEESQQLKPKYKAESTATSVLFSHLNRLHGLNKCDISSSEMTFCNPSHTVPELVTCEVCDKSFNSGSLNIHMSIEHENGSACRSSEKSSQHRVNCFKTSSKSLAWDYFGVLENLDGDALDEYYFYCRLCVEEEGKLSPKYTKNTSTSILLQHLKNAHIPKSIEELSKRKLPEPINFSSNNKRIKLEDFTCKLCGELCESRKSLNRHLVKEHNEEQPRNFTCNVDDCGKSFTMRDTLIKHIKNIHEVSTKYPCDRCPTVLATRMSLHRHIKSCHLKLKSFACDSCNLTYTEMKSLKNHIQKVHMGIVEKRIPCELCDLQFPNQWSLRRHSLTHSGEKPHKCQFCATSYASKGDLAKHLTKIHRDAVYKCEHSGCSAGFRLKNELRDHYKVHYIDEQDELELQSEDYEVISEEFIE